MGDEDGVDGTVHGGPAEMKMRQIARDPLLVRNGPLSFKTASLNLLGWSALVGAGLSLGLVVSLLTPAPIIPAMVAGVLAVWIVMLVVDRYRYGRTFAGIGYGNLDPETGEAVARQLRDQGVFARYEVEYDDEEHEVQRRIVCRRKDAGTVRTAIERALK